MTQVLVVGAGPVGSALALDLARRGVRVRIVDRAPGSFPGSRAKGIQPRTQEVFEDLGVLDALMAGASDYPKMGIHLGPVTIPRAMFTAQPVTDATPHPNIVLSPQFHTDAVLHDALAATGVDVEYDRELVGLTQYEDGVTATLADGETVRADYLVGADGGASAVRKAVGIPFTGTTDEDDRMIIADLQIPGLHRNRWHIWPGSHGRFLGACPLPGGELFQVMLRLPPAEPIDKAPDVLEEHVRAALARKHLTAGAFRWVSLFRPNIRLAEHYRHGRVFLAGDAAHSHTPAGGQGLNTGVQDAHNLGWKLGQVLAGAPADLLDSYEAERRPVAAGVLKLSTERYASFDGNTKTALTRGDEERQLLLNYRGGPLAFTGTTVGGLAAGDRLPDARDADGRRVHQLIAGPDFALLRIGASAVDLPDPRVCSIELPAGTYGAAAPALVLVRPDGYVAAISTGDVEGITRALGRLQSAR